MTGRTFKFWQDHSRQFLEMAYRSDRRESIENPDGYGKHTGACKDTVEVYLIVRERTIQSVAYQTNGCLHTNACANTVANLAEGKTINEAWEITPETVTDFLETLPAEHFHCAELAVGALYRALADYNNIKQQPWKKIYRVR
jgi:nitrogen fixation NifU-like protein